jgi:myosin-5
VFKQETTTYIAEEITFSEVKFVDNQDVLDMVELKPDGLLVMLDDECRVPKGSDLGYLEKIKKTHHLNPRFAVRSHPLPPLLFGAPSPPISAPA